MSKPLTLDTELFLPRPREEVFPFFADAFNLEAITPPFLRFKVTTEAPIEMQVGALIDYKLRLHGIPITWRTRIAAWEPPYRFVDEQLKGPYSLWRHEHTFEEVEGGTLVRDHVDYWPIFGGALVDKLFVRRDLESIFAYRTQRLIELLAPELVTDEGELAQAS